MESYPVPSDPAGMTSEEAGAVLRQMYADGLEHPLFDQNHPQHRDYVAYSTRLRRLIIQDESDQQDALQAQKLEDARAEVGDLTPAECMARGRALLKTKGYLDGTMESKERAALQKEIDSCFLVGCQEPEPNPDEMENDNEPGNLEE